MEQKQMYKRLRKVRDSIDDIMLDISESIAAGELEKQEKRDFDVIAVGKSKAQRDRIKGTLDVIRELEREHGSATLEAIIECGAKQGIDKDNVEAEITMLVQEARIFEPVRYSGNYRESRQD
jgi:DNA replicative helicase MCM subunit Mcm2 (Cdc46/Mcm family)